jgi:hypothetical protein
MRAFHPVFLATHAGCNWDPFVTIRNLVIIKPYQLVYMKKLNQLKKLFVLPALVVLLASATACSKSRNDDDGMAGSPRTEAPDEVLTPAGKNWYAGTISSVYYYDRDNVPVNAGGFIVMFKFNKNGSYEQLTHFDHVTYGVRNRTWTRITGTVEFGTDAEGFSTFTLHPVKGTWSKRTNTESYDDRPIPAQELRNNVTMSTTFRWGTEVDPDFPARRFLYIQNARDGYFQTNLHWEE